MNMQIISFALLFVLTSSCTKKTISEKKSFAFSTPNDQQLVLTHLAEFGFPWSKLVKQELQTSDEYLQASRQKWRRVCFLHSRKSSKELKKLQDSKIFDLQTQLVDLDQIAADSLKNGKAVSAKQVRTYTQKLNDAIFQEIRHDSKDLYRLHMDNAEVLTSVAINSDLFHEFLQKRAEKAKSDLVISEENGCLVNSNAKQAILDSQKAATGLQLTGSGAIAALFVGGIYVPILAPFVAPVALGGMLCLAASPFVMLAQFGISDAQKEKARRLISEAEKKNVLMDHISTSLLNWTAIAREQIKGEITVVKEVLEKNDPAMKIKFNDEILSLISEFKNWSDAKMGGRDSAERTIQLALINNPSRTLTLEKAQQLFDALGYIEDQKHVVCPRHKEDYSYPWLKSIDDDGEFVFENTESPLF